VGGRVQTGLARLRTDRFTWQAAVATDPDAEEMDLQPCAITRLLDCLPWHGG
jgi:hypothetical protein